MSQSVFLGFFLTDPASHVKKSTGQLPEVATSSVKLKSRVKDHYLHTKISRRHVGHSEILKGAHDIVLISTDLIFDTFTHEPTQHNVAGLMKVCFLMSPIEPNSAKKTVLASESSILSISNPGELF